MKAEEWGGVTAIVAAVGALLKWGGDLWAILGGASKARLDEGESVFNRADKMMDRLEKRCAALEARVSALEAERDELRSKLTDCLGRRSAVS